MWMKTKLQSKHKYNDECLKVVVEKYGKEFVNSGRAMGAIGNNEWTSVDIEKVSHVVRGIEYIEATGEVEVEVEVMGTVYGDKLRRMIDDKGEDSVFFSINGIGCVEDGIRYLKEIVSINVYFVV